MADEERDAFIRIISFESHSLLIKCKKLPNNIINIILTIRLYQLHQFKFEYHQTRLHPRNQNCQRQRHLHRVYVLHIHEFQTFQFY